MKRQNLQKKAELDIINTLAIHRRFAKDCTCGVGKPLPFEMCLVIGVFWIKEFGNNDELSFEECKSINFKTFSKLMKTDRVLHSFSEDVFIEHFEYYLSKYSRIYDYGLSWNISIVDIEILFNELRKHFFIHHEISRDVFFEIFNPQVKTFGSAVVWKDIKELVYFLDKCREYSILGKHRYQSFIEKFKMFRTVNSKGDYLKANSLRTTLANIKNESLLNNEFKVRMRILDDIIDNIIL